MNRINSGNLLKSFFSDKILLNRWPVRCFFILSGVFPYKFEKRSRRNIEFSPMLLIYSVFINLAIIVVSCWILEYTPQRESKSFSMKVSTVNSYLWLISCGILSFINLITLKKQMKLLNNMYEVCSRFHYKSNEHSNLRTVKLITISMAFACYIVISTGLTFWVMYRFGGM